VLDEEAGPDAASVVLGAATLTGAGVALVAVGAFACGGLFEAQPERAKNKVRPTTLFGAECRRFTPAHPQITLSIAH
jgi:hypothetical protein